MGLARIVKSEVDVQTIQIPVDESVIELILLVDKTKRFDFVPDCANLHD